jgi:hypothetical protein
MALFAEIPLQGKTRLAARNAAATPAKIRFISITHR